MGCLNKLMGIVDANIVSGKFRVYYDALKDKFSAVAEKYPEYGYLFEFYFILQMF